jgi:putative hemolysin
MNTNHANKAFVLLALITLLASCSAPLPQTAATPVLADSPQANMPNPASVYCEQPGNRLEIRTAADGSQSGVCIFPDGSECDEWAYFRGECGPRPQIPGSIVAPTQTISAPAGSVIPQSVPMPAGALIDPRGDTAQLTQSMIFYNTDGLTLGELLTPLGGNVHAAGPYQGSLAFPLVFQSHEPGGQKQFIDLNSGSTPANPGGQVSRLVSLEDRAMLSGLTGVPGEPVVFFIDFLPVEATLRSRFVLGTIESLPTAAPLFTMESNESMYWIPVAIQVKDGAPQGLWLTRAPWGIGGDMVFPYYEGLTLYDIPSGTFHEFLPPEARFNSISSDETWTAYSMQTETISGFFLLSLQGGEPIPLPTLPENERGAGNAVFSPSNKYIAWREAQGSVFDENFQQTIRIATLEEQQIISEFKDTAFYKTAELAEEGLTILPVGWLDDENLLVQVSTAAKSGKGMVVKMNVTTGQLSLFARGFFAGMFYP